MWIINLRQNARGAWFVNTTASNGKKISTEESFDSPANARRAFMTAGRHMPYARMVVHAVGQKPKTVRRGFPLPESNYSIAEATDLAKAAMAKSPPPAKSTPLTKSPPPAK
jgi:hypothetical protein